MERLDLVRGCLLGSAVGDALGYPVEFLSSAQIVQKYGENGITSFDLTDGTALVSDDTQMTLYTANGLLLGTDYRKQIAACYRDWLKTQSGREGVPSKGEVSPLNALPEMNHRRAPGCTCMSALQQKKLGSVTEPINQSKGCGSIMRVAPIGLYLDDLEEADQLGAEAAALTHGHELGYIPAAFLVHMIWVLIHQEGSSALDAAVSAKHAMAAQYKEAAHLNTLLDLIDRAMQLAQEETDDRQAISLLGEGWVAEETLAIAVYCALKYETDFERAVIAAVNHDGDSDSTGCVTGAILGARLGLQAIPQKFLERLELKETILSLADRLSCTRTKGLVKEPGFPE